MNILEGTVKYYPSLPYKRFNLRLLFGWTLFYHRDAWSLDIQLYGPWKKVGLSEFPQRRKQIKIVGWRRNR